MQRLIRAPEYKILEIPVFLCYSSIEIIDGGTEHGKGEENECYAHSGQA